MTSKLELIPLTEQELADKKIKLNEAEETDNYLIEWDDKKSKWILSRKYFGRKIFMNSCQYKTPLIIVAQDYEKTHI